MVLLAVTGTANFLDGRMTAARARRANLPGTDLSNRALYRSIIAMRAMHVYRAAVGARALASSLFQ